MNVREISFSAPRGVAVNITVSVASAQSAALPEGDYLFICDQACNIVFGANPTALATHLRIPASTMFRITGVLADDKCAVIAAGAGTAWLIKGL